MGTTIKHPITGETIGKIEGREIKNPNTGKTTGIIEDHEDDGLGGCLLGIGVFFLGAMLAIMALVFISPLIGIIGAIILALRKQTRSSGIIFLSITIIVWIIVLIPFFINGPDYDYAGVPTVFVYITIIYTWLVQPVIVFVADPIFKNTYKKLKKFFTNGNQ